MVKICVSNLLKNLSIVAVLSILMLQPPPCCSAENNRVRDNPYSNPFNVHVFPDGIIELREDVNILSPQCLHVYTQLKPSIQNEFRILISTCLLSTIWLREEAPSNWPSSIPWYPHLINELGNEIYYQTFLALFYTSCRFGAFNFTQAADLVARLITDYFKISQKDWKHIYYIVNWCQWAEDEEILYLKVFPDYKVLPDCKSPPYSFYDKFKSGITANKETIQKLGDIIYDYLTDKFNNLPQADWERIYHITNWDQWSEEEKTIYSVIFPDRSPLLPWKIRPTMAFLKVFIRPGNSILTTQGCETSKKLVPQPISVACSSTASTSDLAPNTTFDVAERKITFTLPRRSKKMLLEKKVRKKKLFTNPSNQLSVSKKEPETLPPEENSDQKSIESDRQKATQDEEKQDLDEDIYLPGVLPLLNNSKNDNSRTSIPAPKHLDNTNIIIRKKETIQDVINSGSNQEFGTISHIVRTECLII